MNPLQIAFYYLWPTDLYQRHCSVQQLTSYIRMAQITQRLSGLSKELASNHSGSIHSKYFNIDLTVMKENAIIELSSQLPQSSNSFQNNEVSLIDLDRLPAFRMIFESSVNKYFWGFWKQRYGWFVFFFLRLIFVLAEQKFPTLIDNLSSSVSSFY